MKLPSCNAECAKKIDCDLCRYVQHLSRYWPTCARSNAKQACFCQTLCSVTQARGWWFANLKRTGAAELNARVCSTLPCALLHACLEQMQVRSWSAAETNAFSISCSPAKFSAQQLRAANPAANLCACIVVARERAVDSLY